MKKKLENSVVLTGGKTGGHIYPALAIGAIIKNIYGTNLYYIGDQSGLEQEILKDKDIPFYGLSLGPLVGMSFFRKIKNTFKNIGAGFRSLFILGKIRPKLIIGTGGFVCGPVLFAAWIRRIPIILHEQNVQPGLTNKLLSRVAAEVWLTFPESAEYFPKGVKKVLTGMPLRASFKKMDKEEGKAFFKFDEKKPLLVLTGGSQGSQILNKQLMREYGNIIDELGYQILHITGKQPYDEVMDYLGDQDKEYIEEGKLQILPYVDAMDKALAAADIVIGRAGASFISEVSTYGTFSILVPLKNSAGNHQFKNAKVLERREQGKVIEETEVKGEVFYLTLMSLQKKGSHNIIKGSGGILCGKDTEDIIKKEAGLYL